MSDSRSAYDEQLPWLEAVDDEDGPRGVSARKMLAALLVVLAAAAVVAATFFWLGRQDPAGIGAPQLIRAEPGPYKVKPSDPGGLDVAGESETAFQTSAGEDSDAQLDLSAVPEQPVARPPKEEPKRIPPNETKEPVVEEPAPPPAAPSGGQRQRDPARRLHQRRPRQSARGRRLSARFPSIAAMTKMVVPFSGGIRLRAGAASPADAKQACQALKVAGENCFVANLMQAAIYGLSGPELTPDERDFFRDADPAGYILFARNCVDRAQVRRLTDALRDIHPRADLPILIDQEGGRVARMKPPEWPAFPCGEAFDRLYQCAPSSAIEAARMNARALALVLGEVGVNVDCLPVLDVRQPGATDIVGDRAMGGKPMQVSALGRAVLDGLASAGVIGVVKHMPGHGRALVDSHKELPLVTATEQRARDRPRAVRAPARGADGHGRPYPVHGVGSRAAVEPFAGDHPRHHPRPHRLRRFPDERRYRHGSAQRDDGRARRRDGRRGLRRGAALLREDGRDAVGRGRGAVNERRWRSAAGAGDGERSARR